MNARNGAAARSRKADCESRPAAYGRIASRSIALKVGVMTTQVSTSARPVSTVFGGSVAAPRAERMIPSTTTIRTNEVESTNTNGATESSVSAASTSSGSAVRPC